jgi:hypothetical protein
MSACRRDAFSERSAFRHEIESHKSTVPEPTLSSAGRLLNETCSLSECDNGANVRAPTSAREEGSSPTSAFIIWAPPDGTIGLATKRSPKLPPAGDPVAAKARAGASQIRANSDRPTDEKQKRLDRRGWWLLSRTCGRLGGGPPVFADCSFGTFDDQSGSGRLMAGLATREQ